MNRGILLFSESLIFHVPWNLGQVKTPETSRVVEFHCILRNGIFMFRERVGYIYVRITQSVAWNFSENEGQKL